MKGLGTDTASCGGLNTHTYFFRDRAGIEFVRKLCEGRAPPKTIWCAGCATGDEAYSLAIACLEANGPAPRILATDINTDGLAFARRARYDDHSLRRTDDARKERWFVQSRGRHTVRKEVTDLVTFRCHDVVRSPAPSPTRIGATGRHWDLIVCRNLLFYYDEARRALALRAMAAGLSSGGLLLLGAGEWISTPLASRLPRALSLEATFVHSVLVYRKTPASPNRQATQPSSPSSPVPVGAEPSSSDAVQPPDGIPVARLRELGDVHCDADLIDDAIKAFSAAIAAAPLEPDLHMRLGVCHLRREDAAAAIESLRRALFLDSELWPAAVLLGDLVLRDDATLAQRYFKQALRCLEGGDKHEAGQSASPRRQLIMPFLAARDATRESLRRRLANLEDRAESRAASGHEGGCRFRNRSPMRVK